MVICFLINVPSILLQVALLEVDATMLGIAYNSLLTR